MLYLSLELAPILGVFLENTTPFSHASCKFWDTEQFKMAGGVLSLEHAVGLFLLRCDYQNGNATACWYCFVRVESVVRGDTYSDSTM